MKATSNGAFQGDNPPVYALPLVILQICLVVLVTRLLAFLLRPRRQPRVIAEIVKSPQGQQKEVIANINPFYQMVDEGADSRTATCGDFDVFLSFRGPDTRDTFTDCLYEYMNRTGIRIFRDDEALGPGKNISEILGAVKRSQIYIIVFSQGYASSRWCLRELTCMVECTRQSTGKEILPIFFDVEPLDVKLETEMYNSALNKHEEELGCTEVKPWKEALTTVARIKGWCVKGRRHGKVIADITEKVLQKITIRKRYLPTDLVGIDDHVEAIKKLLSCDTGGVRFVIIHGIGGIGKTTLAETVYNQLFPQFEGHSFLSNIHESSSCRGILKMQRKLVEDLFGFLLHETIDLKEGNNMIKEILPNKRVLLVLDDMDEKDQFMNLAMNSYSYGPGSRIIITTRDFPMTNVDGLEENILTRSGHIFPYEVKEMNFDQALLLFNKLAFNTDSAPCDLYDLSKQVVELTGGLPLAVEVIGSHLRTISKAKWKTTLKKLKEVPHEKVRQRLQISYDALGCEGQQIFLDIGCFFVNKKKDNAMYMWEACDFYPEVEIDILIRKSLIKIDNDRILMHDQLRDLAREIIRQENIRNCGDRSRLWFLEMSQAKKGTTNVVALTPRRSRHNFAREDFANFTNARYLRLDGGNFADDCEDILPELRWLCWRNCPSQLRANNLVLNRLVVLELSGNITTEEWSGWAEIMVASKLKVLKIAGSKSLIKTPCFSKFRSLERLVLKDFPRLAEIDRSVGELQQLRYLKIKWCPRLKELPKEVGCLTALKELILIQGFSVRYLPDSIGNLRHLSRLVMEDTGLVELPDTIKGLVGLTHLCLVNCTSLNSLPDTVGELSSLAELDISGTTIGILPRWIWNLPDLRLRINSFGIRTPLMRDLPMQGLSVRHLPDSISNLRGLPRLSMDDTGSVGYLETINGPGDLESLPLLNFTSLNSQSDAVGELRTWTELYLSGTAIGEQDTRHTLTDCLYEFMNGIEIRPFRDDEDLRPGKMKSEILQEVKGSQIRLRGIRKLVMSATADNRYFRKMAEIKCRKSIFVRDKAHISCQNRFICDGHLIRPRDPPSLTTSTPGAGNSILSKSQSATLQRSGTAKLSNPFQDILKRVFSLKADQRAVMPIASPSPDSTPSEQPNAASMVKRQDTFQELGQFSRSLSHPPHSIQSAYHTGCSLLFDTLVCTRELALKMIAIDETLWTIRQERELLQIDLENALQKAEEVSRRKGDSSGRKYFSEFSMTEIKEAVRNFDPSLKIGEGGYGRVYRGFLRHTPVAIEIMKFPSMQGSQEFQQEVDVLSKVRHTNLIKLIGACPKRCTLVYEYIPKGSLEDWLCSSNRAKQLPWQVRTHIVTELCSALSVLHSCKPHSIVHRDVKPGNILLDGHLTSKLSDFGICRLLSRGERSSNTTTVLYPTDPIGTFGYMDPEFLVTRALTTKSDIYSFGIILLELLTRRPALGIANVVRRAISAGTLEAMLDPLAGEWPYMLVEELSHLASRCCEMSRRNRPDLRSDVWTVLQSIRASCR